jgi:TfoX/Sxy family transcriptional regulator of competence genes
MTFQGEDEVSKRNLLGGVILYVSAVVTLLMMLGPVIYGLYIGPPKPVNARKIE